MSHEIRTPMNAILGYAQILHRDPSLLETHREAMETILSSGGHLLALINDILDLSKIEAGRVEVTPVVFDLGRLVDEIMAMFRGQCQEKAIALVVHRLGWVDLSVRGDQGKLRQALINLVGNAVKFTDSGSITLTVERGDDDAVRFEVADTGPGIAPAAEAGIFEPFQQASAGISRGGTGLGLAITRQHVELMGGRLGLKSAPGEGSRFSFVLWLPEGENITGAAMRQSDDRMVLAEAASGVRAPLAELPAEDEEIEKVPEELRLQLIAAAEMCSITDLKECMQQLEACAIPARSLIKKLKRCIREYDLAGVQRLLGCEALEAGMEAQ
jgi:hypothetical protein